MPESSPLRLSQIEGSLQSITSTNVAVLSSEDLSLVFSPATSEGKEGYLSEVAWSSDGSALYAGGNFPPGNRQQIRKWVDGGRGQAISITVAENVIAYIHSLNNGEVLYASIRPSFGILKLKDEPTSLQEAVTIDYRVKPENLLLSQDAYDVQFGYQFEGQSTAHFSIAARKLILDPTPNRFLKPPLVNVQELSFSKSGGRLQVNGQVLGLEPNEGSTGLAITPDHQAFLLGSNKFLRLLDKTGRERWKIPVPSRVGSVNIAGNALVAIVTVDDGTIRWYRMSDGKELLAFFPHADRKRWVLWTPKGYFDASEGGLDLIGWHVNQGKDKEALFYPASQFFEQFYRPDLIAEVLKSVETDEQVLARLGEKERVNMQAGFKKPPTVAIVSPKPGESFDRDEVDVEVLAEDQGGGVDEIRLYHNGKVVGGDTRGVAVTAGQAAGKAVVLPPNQATWVDCCARYWTGL